MSEEVMKWKMNLWNSLPERKKHVLAEVYKAQDFVYASTILKGDQNVQATLKELFRGGLLKEKQMSDPYTQRYHHAYAINADGKDFFEECFFESVKENPYVETNAFLKVHVDVFRAIEKVLTPGHTREISSAAQKVDTRVVLPVGAVLEKTSDGRFIYRGLENEISGRTTPANQGVVNEPIKRRIET